MLAVFSCAVRITDKFKNPTIFVRVKSAQINLSDFHVCRKLFKNTKIEGFPHFDFGKVNTLLGIPYQKKHQKCHFPKGISPDFKRVFQV